MGSDKVSVICYQVVDAIAWDVRVVYIYNDKQ